MTRKGRFSRERTVSLSEVVPIDERAHRSGQSIGGVKGGEWHPLSFETMAELPLCSAPSFLKRQTSGHTHAETAIKELLPTALSNAESSVAAAGSTPNHKARTENKSSNNRNTAKAPFATSLSPGRVIWLRNE